jgi:hypothetical protein
LLANLLGYLLMEEFFLAQYAIALDVSPAAHLAQCNTTPSTQGIQNQWSTRNLKSSRSSGHDHGGGQSNGSYHGSSQGTSSSNHPICQICNHVGHVAFLCHNKFNNAFQ